MISMTAYASLGSALLYRPQQRDGREWRRMPRLRLATASAGNVEVAQPHAHAARLRMGAHAHAHAHAHHIPLSSPVLVQHNVSVDESSKQCDATRAEGAPLARGRLPATDSSSRPPRSNREMSAFPAPPKAQRAHACPGFPSETRRQVPSESGCNPCSNWSVFLPSAKVVGTPPNCQLGFV